METDADGRLSHTDTRLLLDQIADKWSILILAQVCRGPLRFNSLKRSIPGVSQKALTQTLRRLERNGILERVVISMAPVAVEYRVTPLGKTLKGPFEALFNWTNRYARQVYAAQESFDRARKYQENVKNSLSAETAPDAS